MTDKLKLYCYPNTPQEILALHGYPDAVPFTPEGIERWCERVGPTDAEMFYGGQYNHETKWMLNPARFAYFKDNETRHVFDMEGDYSYDMPDWMMPCVISAMNAVEKHRAWNVMVRPACSKLLVDMVKRDIPYTPPTRTGFYFRGQRDVHGLRDRLRDALREAGVPHFFAYNDRWNAPTPVTEEVVKRYEAEMREWSWALCPGGMASMMTVRFYEACALGRAPLAISWNEWFASPSRAHHQIEPDSSVQLLVKWLRTLSDISSDHWDHYNRTAKKYFDTEVRTYFADPTKYFLAWMTGKGLLREGPWMGN